MTVGIEKGYYRVRTLRHCDSGEPFYVWEPVMPPIPKSILDCTIYLYGSREAAREGEAFGGSGFLIGVGGLTGPAQHVYAVTNSHVISEGRSPVIRLNVNGEAKIFPIDESAWIHHPHGDDVAICPLQVPALRYGPVIRSHQFVSREDVSGDPRYWPTWPGADVCMVGRFLTHEGKQQNTPTVRFGNVAMLPLEPITGPRGIKQESYLVEMHSLPGYSGSPVFIYESYQVLREQDRFGLRLLGIDWCHLNRYEPVLEKTEDGYEEISGQFVKSNTGMAGVVPAWKLTELLNSEEVMELRKEEDRRRKKDAAKSPASLDVQERPFTKSDFEGALKKVSRRVPPLKSGKEKK